MIGDRAGVDPGPGPVPPFVVTPPGYVRDVRILHTSDWHLGRLFHGASLHDDQVAALDRIVDIVRAEQVELVVVAGDLYDRAIPAAPAVELFDDTLARLRDTGASVVAISGNHDSGVRVGYGDRLLTRAGVTVRGSVARAAEPVLVPSTDGESVAVEVRADIVGQYIARLAAIPLSSVDQLAIRDFNACMGVVMGFFNGGAE